MSDPVGSTARRTLRSMTAHAGDGTAGPSQRGAAAMLRSRMAWLSVVVAGALALVMTFAYVGAFVNPIGHLSGLSVGLVNLDAPVDVAGQHLAVGQQFVAGLEQQIDASTGEVTLRIFPDEPAARSALAENRVAGVIVLPVGLSAGVGAVGTSLGAAAPVTVTLLRNEGAGSLQPAVFDTFARDAVDGLSASASAQLVTVLASLNISIAPANIGSIARPVISSSVGEPAIGNSGGRGLPPFYVAVMVTLTAILAATALHLITGLLGGADHLEVLGRELRVPLIVVDRWQRWLVEAALAVPVSIVGGLGVAWMAIGVLGAHADAPAQAAMFSIAAMMAMVWFAQAFLAAFGLLGDLFVILLTTIFGVPSARGVYPKEALPGFFGALGDALPLRWITDGMRAIFFFDGRGTAGLTGAWTAVLIYAVLGVALGVIASRLSERRAVTPVR